MKQTGRKSAATATITALRPAATKFDPPTCPADLGEPEHAIWDHIHRDYILNRSGCHVLAATLRAHQASRECRAQIKIDGKTIKDRNGNRRAHPLLSHEHSNFSAFLAGLRALNVEM